ncbi:Carboxypeptidase regulatory-like domain containing protein [Burkholderiales bacterium]
MSQSPLFVRSALALAIAASLSPLAIAQNTSSSIGGLVSDGSGKAIAGATVVVTHAPSGTRSVTLSDATGRFLATGLRVGGPYTVTATKGGQTAKEDNLVLKLAEPLELALTIGAAPVQTVTVLGQKGFTDPRSNRFGAGTSFSQADLENLPGFGRDLQEVARLDPRVSQVDKSTDKISALGQNFRYNTITIDGVGVSDPFGLSSNGLPTLKQPIPFDAIDSVQVNVSNFDVTQFGYSGANINAVTKSGTNKLSGSVYYAQQDERMAGDRVTNLSTNATAKQADFKVTNTGFTLGGPIIKDKLFFFVNAEKFKDSRAGTPQYGPVGSNLINIGITQSDIEKIQSISKTTYGFEAGNLVPSQGELISDSVMGKIDWNINQDHRLTLTYSDTDSNEPLYYGMGSSSLSLTSYWTAESKKFKTNTVQVYSDWSDNFSTEFKLGNRTYDKVFANNSAAPSIQIQFEGSAPAGSGLTSSANRSVYLGTEQFRHYNILKTDTQELFLAGTYTMGAHELKFGGTHEKNDVFNAFLPQSNGVYFFECDERFAYTSFTGAVTCSNGATAALAALENFQKGRPSSYTVRVPQAGLTLDQGAAEFSYQNTGLFLQDTWRVNRDLTILAGVRMDTQTTDDRPLKSNAGAQPLVAGNPATNTNQTGGFGRDNSAINDEMTLVQPRFAFTWNLRDAMQSRVRGGYGLFKGGAPTVWFSNPYSNTGVQTLLASCSGTGGSACPTGGLAVTMDPTKQPTLPGSPPIPAIDFNDGGLELPSIWKGNLAYEATLKEGYVVSAEYIRTDTNADIYFEHLNLGPATRTGPDGRQMFFNAAGYKDTSFSVASNGAVSTVSTAGVQTKFLRNRSFDNVILTKKTDKGYGNTVTLSLAKPAAGMGFGWNAAYTYSDVKSVHDGSSSVAYSNWRYFPRLQANEEELARSRYEIRNRVNLGATYKTKLFGNLTTSFGIFAEHRTGYPYSWTFYNDANGDGQTGNDLLYIPSAPGSGEVVFAAVGNKSPAESELAFWNVVNSEKGLSSHKGSVVPRNSSTAPRVNVIDFRMSQDVPAFNAQHRASVSFDIFNLGNLLNSKWGRTMQSVNEAREFVSYAGMTADGRYIYAVGTPESLALQQSKNESQWALRITAKYQF